jgi:hypothetical protein
MSSRGGRRPGSGRKKGSRAKAVREIVEKAVAAGLTPLQYMLNVLNDENASAQRRDAMAIAAAQYCHPRLAAHIVSPDGDRPRQTGIKVELVLPRGYRLDERGQVIEHEPLQIEREPESETEH